MDWILVSALAVILVFTVLFMIAARKIEERHELWEQFMHPPDMEVRDDEPDP